VQADLLLCVHRDAAGDVIEVLAKANLCDELLQFAEAALAGESGVPATHGAQGFGIGREPGEAVYDVLFAVDGSGGNPAALVDAACHVRAGLCEQAVHHARCLLHQAIETVQQCGVGANVFCDAHRYFLSS
jgi:hypothetical protein